MVKLYAYRASLLKRRVFLAYDKMRSLYSLIHLLTLTLTRTLIHISLCVSASVFAFAPTLSITKMQMVSMLIFINCKERVSKMMTVYLYSLIRYV